MATDPLANYPDAYLECRVDGHTWQRARWVLISGSISERIRQCRRCGSRRVQVINTRKWTQLGHKNYRYAKGYTRPGAGLVAEDFAERHLMHDHEAAEREGRVR